MKKSLILGAVAIAGAAYLYKKYKSGKGQEEVKDFSRKAKNHLTNVFARAKSHAMDHA